MLNSLNENWVKLSIQTIRRNKKLISTHKYISDVVPLYNQELYETLFFQWKCKITSNRDTIFWNIEAKITYSTYSK